MGHHNKKKHHEEKEYTKKRGGNGYKIFTVVTFVILAVYLAGYLVSFATRPSVRVESVEMGSIMLPATIEGLIIREESVVTSTRSGTPEYFYTDNERVAKNKVICSVEDSDKVEKIEAEIDTIDRSIIDIQKNRTDISIFSSDIKNIEKQIDEVFDDYTYKFLSGDISGVYDMKERTVSHMDARTNIWVAEASQSLSELQSQRLNYEAQLGENKSYITNDVSGIVSYRTDGFESEFTPESMASITKENFKMNYDVSYIRHSSDVNEGDPLFKIVSSNEYHFFLFCSTLTFTQ